MRTRGLDLGRLAVGRTVLFYDMVGAKGEPMLCTGAGDGNRVTLRALGGAARPERTGIRHLDEAPHAHKEYTLGFWSLARFDDLLVGVLFPEDGGRWGDMPARDELAGLLSATGGNN